MKHKKQPVHNPALWRSLLDQCVSRAPSVRQAPVDGSGYKEPYGTLMSWIKDRASPPVTKIIAAASLLGCTEQQVAMAVHGFNSQAEAVEARKTEQARRYNRACREKYATSPELKLKNKMRAEESKEKRRAKIFAGPMFTRVWMNCAGHMKKEGVITAAEIKFLQGVTAARYKRSEAYKLHRIKDQERRKQSASYLLSRANGLMTRMEQKLASVKRQLETSAKIYNRPWHLAGYKTRERWEAETPEGRRYQLEHWQAVTHRRRAKEMQAGGRGVTRDEWFAIMKKWDYHCAYCGARRYSLLPNGSKVKMTMDHVIAMPLGKNEPCNILPACHSCNSSKSGNDLMVWAATKGVNVHPLAVEQYNRLLDKYTEPTHATW